LIQASAAGLNQVKQFVWCGDGDDAGRILRDDMVKLLGAARLYFVEWPEGVFSKAASSRSACFLSKIPNSTRAADQCHHNFHVRVPLQTAAPVRDL
jgi:hypothetical protein